MSDLIMLIIKNLKQKRLNKKLFYKFMNFFRIVDKIKAQAYRLLLSIIHWIYNIFYIFYCNFIIIAIAIMRRNLLCKFSNLSIITSFEKLKR